MIGCKRFFGLNIALPRQNWIWGYSGRRLMRFRRIRSWHMNHTEWDLGRFCQIYRRQPGLCRRVYSPHIPAKGIPCHMERDDSLSKSSSHSVQRVAGVAEVGGLLEPELHKILNLNFLCPFLKIRSIVYASKLYTDSVIIRIHSSDTRAFKQAYVSWSQTQGQCLWIVSRDLWQLS